GAAGSGWHKAGPGPGGAGRARREVQRLRLDRAAGRAAGRPGGQSAPRVGAGLEGNDRRDRRRLLAVLAVLQIPVEKRAQDLAAERERGVAAELHRPDRRAVADLLAVVPRPEHQEYLVVVRVLGLERLVHRDRTVDILLVPEAVDQHHRHGERLLGEQLVDRLVTPERIIAGVRGDLVPEPDLV